MAIGCGRRSRHAYGCSLPRSHGTGIVGLWEGGREVENTMEGGQESGEAQATERYWRTVAAKLLISWYTDEDPGKVL